MRGEILCEPCEREKSLGKLENASGYLCLLSERACGQGRRRGSYLRTRLDSATSQPERELLGNQLPLAMQTLRSHSSSGSLEVSHFQAIRDGTPVSPDGRQFWAPT